VNYFLYILLTLLFYIVEAAAVFFFFEICVILLSCSGFMWIVDSYKIQFFLLSHLKVTNSYADRQTVMTNT